MVTAPVPDVDTVRFCPVPKVPSVSELFWPLANTIEEPGLVLEPFKTLTLLVVAATRLAPPLAPPRLTVSEVPPATPVMAPFVV